MFNMNGNNRLPRQNNFGGGLPIFSGMQQVQPMQLQPIPQLGNPYGSSNVFDNTPNPFVGSGGGLQNNGYGNTFDNIPNPFVANSPTNPFFNPDQALDLTDPRSYEGTFGNSLMPEMPTRNDVPQFTLPTRNIPDRLQQPRQIVRGGMTFNPPVPIKQQVPIVNPAVDRLPLMAENPMETLIKMLMFSPGNFRF